MIRTAARQYEAGNSDRQPHSGQRFTKRRANAGVNQHLLEDAASPDHQQNNPGRCSAWPQISITRSFAIP